MAAPFLPIGAFDRAIAMRHCSAVHSADVTRSSLTRAILGVVVAAAVGSGCTGSGPSQLTNFNEAVTTDATRSSSAADEQAVIVYLRLTRGDFGSVAERQKISVLEDKLIAAIDASGVGEYDGNEFGEGGVTLYAYGPNADALFAVMESSIREFAPNPGSSATLRYGTAENLAAKERVVSLP